MSKFNHIAKEFDQIAKNAMREYEEAQTQLKAAEKALSEAPTYSTDAAKRVRLEADLMEKKEAFKNAKEALTGKHLYEIQKLRDKLLAEIDSSLYGDSVMVDMPALELMKAGVMLPGDYEKLMEKAISENNIAMVRLVSKYAKEEADKIRANDPDKAGRLRNVLSRSREVDGSEQVKAFDYMSDVYNRSTRNPAMINYWEYLTQRVIEAF
ncbi:MAG: hypothetical protein IJF27_05190 [Oscillospiraceae bacterium]|nr:hypothetical protein [Oscillospiraceae bacterium]